MDTITGEYRSLRTVNLALLATYRQRSVSAHCPALECMHAPLVAKEQ